MTALWFWDVGGMGFDRTLRSHGPIPVNSILCYTCGANFAWPSGSNPQCPVCKSRGTCNSPPLLIPGAFDITISAGYVRDPDAPLPPRSSP